MQVAKCALCGKVPAWDDFDIECCIDEAKRAYSCCGTRCKNAKTWNRVQVALMAEKELGELKELCRKFIKTLYNAHAGNLREGVAELERLCGGGE